MRRNLIQFTERGLYVEQADVYIDPWKPVKKALITHGHSDHARYGSKEYLCTQLSVPILKHRLGSHNLIKGLRYGEEININGVKFSFHPAGHIIGSAQIRVEYKGEIWVVSGDYKLENDGTSTPFEIVKCHHFITESTFGLPVFNWKPQSLIFEDLNAWWAKNKEEGRTSIITAYALGKAQRIINAVNHDIGPIFTHGAVENMNEVLRSGGSEIKPTIRLTDKFKKIDFSGSLVVATATSVFSNWSKRLGESSIAMASGWMAMRGARRRRGAEKGFILSDHADWGDLLLAIKNTEAENIYVTHGYTDIFSKYLKEIGYNASVVETAYEGETLEGASQEELIS